MDPLQLLTILSALVAAALLACSPQARGVLAMACIGLGTAAPLPPAGLTNDDSGTAASQNDAQAADQADPAAADPLGGEVWLGTACERFEAQPLTGLTQAESRFLINTLSRAHSGRSP